MRTIFCLGLFFFFTLSSCKRSEPIAQKQDRKALYERFNGRYEILSAIASEALDINLDGISSFNLKEELTTMGRLGLQIQISDFKGANSFDEFWSEPVFSGPVPKHYDPSISVYYGLESAFRTFEFSEDLSRILLNPESPNTNLQRHPRPDSILIQSGDLIEVTRQKEFYTTSGWKKVTLVILYKRFSKLNSDCCNG